MREEIKTVRLLLRGFRESDYDNLFEFLSQLEDDEFERNGSSWGSINKIPSPMPFGQRTAFP